MDKKLISFLQDHHILTLATVDKEKKPYCCNCFYLFDEKTNSLIIASSTDTKHITHTLTCKSVAGSIYLDTKTIGLIQGVQFTAHIEEANKEQSKAYFKAFPYALAMRPTLWQLQLEYLKFTDNTLGFGNKKEFYINQNKISK